MCKPTCSHSLLRDEPLMSPRSENAEKIVEFAEWMIGLKRFALAKPAGAKEGENAVKFLAVEPDAVAHAFVDDDVRDAVVTAARHHFPALRTTAIEEAGLRFGGCGGSLKGCA